MAAVIIQHSANVLLDSLNQSTGTCKKIYQMDGKLRGKDKENRLWTEVDTGGDVGCYLLCGT